MLKRNRIGFGSPDYLQQREPLVQAPPPPVQDVVRVKRPVPINQQIVPPKRKSKYQRDN
jgi:hypothetical protein